MVESTYAIELKNISKTFGKLAVFENLNLNVAAGSICGISGPNGAGKSILLRIICGLVRPTSGQVYIMNDRIGVDLEFPRLTGVLIDSPGFLSNYSGRKNLELLAKISNRANAQRIEEVLNIVGLDPLDGRPVKVYSNGMRKRLGIAQAILEKPRVLILDEPTDAIDQAGWKDVYEYLIGLKDEGAAILLSSNNLDEITILCDQAFILEGGHLKLAF